MALQFIAPGDGTGSCMFYDTVTGEAGFAIKLINKTGGASIKGYTCDAATGTDKAFKYTTVNEIDCIGICMETGIVDGQPVWIAVQGKVLVYFSGDTVRGHYARIGVDADTGEVAGQAISEAIPTSPFSVDKHFAEIGHVIEARSGAGLAMVVLHFN